MSKIVHELNFDMRMTHDGDEWSWALGWWFAVAEILYLASEEVPSHWQYRPSPLYVPGTVSLSKRADNDDGDYSFEVSTVAALYLDGVATADDLRYAGNVLTRYANLVKLAGKDY